MGRRIGIVTFDQDKSNGKAQRRSYVWDMKGLLHLEMYAQTLSQWTTADIVDLLWCRDATVFYHLDRAQADRREFVFHDDVETSKKKFKGEKADAWPFEDSVRLFFSQIRDERTIRRSVSWSAPLKQIFTDEGLLRSSVGSVVAETIEQCTGCSPITFTSGKIRVFPQQTEEKGV